MSCRDKQRKLLQSADEGYLNTVLFISLEPKTFFSTSLQRGLVIYSVIKRSLSTWSLDKVSNRLHYGFTSYIYISKLCINSATIFISGINCVFSLFLGFLAALYFDKI